MDKAVRNKSGYKLRPDGPRRPWGGINTLILGDFWQIEPVTETPLCAGPDKVGTGVAEHGRKLLWSRGASAIQRVYD